MSTRYEDVAIASYEVHENLVKWCRTIEFTIDGLRENPGLTTEDAKNMWKAIEALQTDVAVIKAYIKAEEKPEILGI